MKARSKKFFTLFFLIVMVGAVYPMFAQESSDANQGIHTPAEEKECQSKDFKVDVDEAIVKKMNIKTHKVKSAPYTQKLSAVGVVEIPIEKTVNISSRTKGFISSTNYKMGDEVEKDDIDLKKPLAIVNSKELSHAKAAFINKNTELGLLKMQYDREKSLYQEKLSKQKDVLEAEMKFEKAKIGVVNTHQNLKLLGLSDKAIDKILAEKDLSPLMPIYAPFPGKITEKKITVGSIVNSDEPLFVLADLNKLNVCLDIYEKDMRSVELGQRVILTSKIYRERKFKGKVTYISDSIDSRTRTLKVWVTVKNKSRTLKPGMFMSAEIIVSNNEDMIRIPLMALQNDGLSCCTLVFVLESRPGKTEAGNKKYKVTTHKVEVGREDKNSVQILAGLLPNQNVITEGAYMIKSELLKNSFGAG